MFPMETNNKGMMSQIMGRSRWSQAKMNTPAGRWARKYLNKGKLAGKALQGLVASVGMFGTIEVLKAIQKELEPSDTEGNQWITNMINELKKKSKTQDWYESKHVYLGGAGIIAFVSIMTMIWKKCKGRCPPQITYIPSHWRRGNDENAAPDAPITEDTGEQLEEREDSL